VGSKLVKVVPPVPVRMAAYSAIPAFIILASSRPALGAAPLY
jgi:hypothetical protein